MASKSLLLVLACLLLVNTRVSSERDEEIFVGVPTPTPVVKTPAPTPPVVVVPPAQPPVRPPRNTQECFPLCVERCKFHSRKNICLRACVTCCDRCKCVPPGQYGNHEKCGKCYAGMTTRGGKLKCP